MAPSTWNSITIIFSLFNALAHLTPISTALPQNALIHEEGGPTAEAMHIVFASTATLLPDMELVKKIQKALVTIRANYPQVEQVKNNGLWKIGKLLLSSYYDELFPFKIIRRFGPIAYMNVVEHQRQQIGTIIMRQPYNSLLLAKQIEDELNITATPDFNFPDNNSVQYHPEVSSFNFFNGSHYWVFHYDNVTGVVRLDKEDYLDATTPASPNENPSPMVSSAVVSIPQVYFQLRNGTFVRGSEDEIDKLIEQEQRDSNATLVTPIERGDILEEESEISMSVRLNNGTVVRGSQAEMDMLIERDHQQIAETAESSNYSEISRVNDHPIKWIQLENMTVVEDMTS